MSEVNGLIQAIDRLIELQKGRGPIKFCLAKAPGFGVVLWYFFVIADRLSPENGHTFCAMIEESTPLN